jgi:hypothetical protein
MTDLEREKILSRVRKMMNLANNAGASEGERDNAMRMAHATLAKYNLEMAQVEATTHKQTEGEKRVETEAVFYGRPWARNVAHSAAELCFCSYLYVAGRRAGQTKHCFIGRTSNAVTASELARYLVESINKEARRHQREHVLGNEGYRAFAWGAATTIRRRVKEIRAAAEKPAEATGQALILYVADEEKANKALIVQLYGPKLGSGRSGRGFYDANSNAAGRAFGETVSLNRQVGGGTSAQKRLT